jgi:alpha-tubulin suppressor-like RCC1 family protein
MRLTAPLLLACACVTPLDVLTSLDAGIDAGPSGAFSLGAGDEHSCAIRGGPLYCWGTNSDGRVGNGTMVDTNSPVQVGGDRSWLKVSAGERHTCALKLDGSVWCWGGNGAGQLGQNDTQSRASPTKVDLALPALDLQSKSSFSCALLTDHALWCWGANFEGQLGLDDPFNSPDRLAPQRNPTDAGWATFSTGQGHACGIRLDGSLWCWGRNSRSTLGLKVDAGEQFRSPQRIGTDTDWLSLDANQEYTCALKQDHSLWCWGNLPLSTSLVEKPTPFLGGAWAMVRTNVFHACVLSMGGEAKCWGRNIEGELGLGDLVERPAPTPLLEAPLSEVALGRFHSCQRRSNGSTWCTGENQFGELGVGDTTRRNVWTELSFP